MYQILHLPRVNSKTFKPLATFETIEATITALEYMGCHSYSKPYIFTSIYCIDKDNKPLRITQSVTIGRDNREIPVSPEKLYQTLTN